MAGPAGPGRGAAYGEPALVHEPGDRQRAPGRPAKLSALYQDKLTDASVRTGTLFTNRLAALDHLKPEANPYAAFRRLVLETIFKVW